MSGKNAKRTSENDKWHYKNYKSSGKFAINKRKKIERHLKKHPEDKQAIEASKNIPDYRRKTPMNKVWTPQRRYFAELLSEAGVNGNIALIDPFADR